MMNVDDAVVPTSALEEVVLPLRCIPPEIITKIIRKTLPAEICYGHIMQDRIMALLVATSICRHWRYALLDHATLWSIVPIHCKSLGQLYLQRSRNVPLSIIFYADAKGPCSAHQATVSLLPHMQRVKKVQLFAPSQALNGILSTLGLYGTCLEDISLEIKPAPTREGWTAIQDHLLKHASALEALRLDAYEFHFPTDQFQQFTHLSRLELSGVHDLCDASHLLTSFQTLTSIKISLEAIGSHEDYRRLPDRIVPHPNLRRIHLRAGCYPIKVVLDALKIQSGVHLECEIIECRHWRGVDEVQFLPLPSEFLENTSHIEELEIHGSVELEFKCYGSGPSGSFYIKGFYPGKVHRPIEDLSHLRRLTVADAIKQEFLEDIVGSAPLLTSLVFNYCAVSKCRPAGHAIQGLPRLDGIVDTDTFVAAIDEERHAGVENFRSATVNGVLQGERLQGFKSIIKTYI